MERYYSIQQVAPMLGIKVRTVRDWISKGKLHAIKMHGGRKWAIAETEILRIQGVVESNENKD